MDEKSTLRTFVEQLLRQKGDTDAFSDSDSLVTNGRLESIDVLTILLFLEEHYGIDFSKHGFDQNDVDSLDEIVSLIHANKE